MGSLLNCCFRTVRWLPVVFIFAVICWSYYAYVVELLIKTIPEDNIAEKVILGLLYHPVLFIFLWAYYKIVYTDPKGPPSEFYVSKEEAHELREAKANFDSDREKQILEQCVKSLPVITRTVHMGIRYCEICQCIKPDRAHHCSVCKQCVLKMDHHCPWVNNCVSFINYKFFILFLLYAEVYCLYVAFSDLKYFINFWTGISGLAGKMNFHILFLFIVSIMFALSVLGLLGYHIYLVLRNQSTLESFRHPIFVNSGPDKHGFNVGRPKNWREVFGDDFYKWFLPVPSCKGDGISYPTKFHTQSIHNYNSMENGQILPPNNW